MKQTDPQFKLRLPVRLKEALEKARVERDRTLTAEIVARLEQSFQAAGTEVDWGKRLELRSNELRLDTVRTHLFSAQQLATQLEEELKILKARNGAKEGQLTLGKRLAVVKSEVERLNQLHAELLREQVRLQQEVDDAFRPIAEKLDSEADLVNQAHYSEISASEDKVGIPAKQRAILKK